MGSSEPPLDPSLPLYIFQTYQNLEMFHKHISCYLKKFILKRSGDSEECVQNYPA